MTYEFVKAAKSAVATEEAVRAVVKAERPEFQIEAVGDKGDHWLVRLVKDEKLAADFPFKKKDDAGKKDDVDVEPQDDSEDTDTDPDDDGDNDSNEDTDSDDDKGDEDKKPKGEDALSRLKELVHEISGLFNELTNKAGEAVQKADDQQKAVDDIAGTLDQHRSPGSDAAMTLDDIGPTPGSPPGPPHGGPGVPSPKVPPGPEAPGMPGFNRGKKPLPPGGGISAFTNRLETATHPGTDAEGNKISLTAAALELENDPQFEEYEVVAMKEDDNGQF